MILLITPKTHTKTTITGYNLIILMIINGIITSLFNTPLDIIVIFKIALTNKLNLFIIKCRGNNFYSTWEEIQLTSFLWAFNKYFVVVKGLSDIIFHAAFAEVMATIILDFEIVCADVAVCKAFFVLFKKCVLIF